MKRTIVSIVIAATALMAALAQAGEKAYVDQAGDSATAPDLRNVVVTDANGFLAFKIDGALVPDSTIEVYIDSDRNQSTGDEGDELYVAVYMEGDGKSYYDVERWNGSKWDSVGFDVKSQSFSGREEIGFKAADAGLTGSFDFVLRSVKMVADAVEGGDRAPDSIVPWTYTLSATATTVARTVLGSPTLVPARPVAGKLADAALPRSARSRRRATHDRRRDVHRHGEGTAAPRARLGGGWLGNVPPRGAAGLVEDDGSGLHHRGLRRPSRHEAVLVPHRLT